MWKPARTWCWQARSCKVMRFFDEVWKGEFEAVEAASAKAMA